MKKLIGVMCLVLITLTSCNEFFGKKYPNDGVRRNNTDEVKVEQTLTKEDGVYPNKDGFWRIDDETYCLHTSVTYNGQSWYNSYEYTQLDGIDSMVVAQKCMADSIATIATHLGKKYNSVRYVPVEK